MAKEPLSDDDGESQNAESEHSANGASNSESELSDSENDESDSSECESDDVGVAVNMPKRTTRGKGYERLIGEAQAADADFWGHETWKESDDDAEYCNSEGEEIYKDVIDSDFDCNEDSSGEEAEGEEGTGRKSSKVIVESKPKSSRKNKKNTSKHFYEKILQRNKKVKGDKGDAIEVNLVREDDLSMEEQLAICKKTEEENSRKLLEVQQHKEWKKIYNEWKATTYKGHYAMLVSWASYLQLDTNKQDNSLPEVPSVAKTEPDVVDSKSQCQDILNDKEDVHECVLYIFTDGKIPTLYKQIPIAPPSQNTCVVTGKEARYFDPLTRCSYANSDAFRGLRECYHRIREESVYHQLYDLENLITERKNDLSTLQELSEKSQNFAVDVNTIGLRNIKKQMLDSKRQSRPKKHQGNKRVKCKVKTA